MGGKSLQCLIECEVGRIAGKKASGHTGRWLGRQVGRRAGRRVGGQTDRQTNEVGWQVITMFYRMWGWQDYRQEGGWAGWAGRHVVKLGVIMLNAVTLSAMLCVVAS